MKDATWSTRAVGAVVAAGLAGGCTGIGADFGPKFEAVPIGATQQQVGVIAGAPFSTQAWNLAGLSLARYEYLDARSRYEILIVATPLTAARVIAKVRTPLIGCGR